MTLVLDVGPSSSLGVDAHLAAFVDRLAGDAATGPADAARRRIHASITAGAVPPGLRRLAEALAADAEGMPRPRHPVEDADSVAGALRTNSLVVLDDFDVDAVVGALAALLRDGRRVAVTAADRADLTALRDALTPAIVRCCADALLALGRRAARAAPAARHCQPRAPRPPRYPAPARRPLPARRRRRHPRRPRDRDQRGRPGAARRAAVGHGRRSPRRGRRRRPHRRRRAGGTRSAHPRRVVVDVAAQPRAQHVRGRVRRPPRAGRPGARREPPRAGGTPVAVLGGLPPHAPDTLRRYAEFLRAGGRNRSYFRNPAQRDVQPVLRQLRVGDAVPETPEQIEVALRHLELADRLRDIDAACRQAGVPAPRSAADLVDLDAALRRVGTAARAVGTLRHDVLFIHPNSPVSVPDLDSAQQVTAAILDYDAHGSADEAARRLEAMVGELARLIPVTRMAPEHTRAVEALRANDVTGYAAALDDLAAARSIAAAENRCAELTERLRRELPRVAEAWEAASADRQGGFGLAWFVEADRLLENLPEADTVDVVLLLGAAEVGVDRLLLTAVAPRLAAVVAPGVRPAEGPTLLSVVQRASALVVAGRPEPSAPAARVVRLSDAARARAAAGSARQDPA
ncbi:hypothetical protein ACFQV8_38615 [Pseudonocardia benzenivorans]